MLQYQDLSLIMTLLRGGDVIDAISHAASSSLSQRVLQFLKLRLGHSKSTEMYPTSTQLPQQQSNGNNLSIGEEEYFRALGVTCAKAAVRILYARILRIVISVAEYQLPELEFILRQYKVNDMVNTVHAHPWPKHALVRVIQTAITDAQHVCVETKGHHEKTQISNQTKEPRIKRTSSINSSECREDLFSGENHDCDKELESHNQQNSDDSTMSKNDCEMPESLQPCSLKVSICEQLSKTILEMLNEFLETCSTCGFEELAEIFDSMQTTFLKRAAVEVCNRRWQKLAEYSLTRNRLQHACHRIDLV